MEIFNFFGYSGFNFMIYASFSAFILYFISIRLLKLPEKPACHADMNKLNAFFLLLYIIIVAIYCIAHKIFNFQIIAAFIGGVFVFLTLQQIYLMALIGLVKKSVSIAILEAANNLSQLEETQLSEKFSKDTEAIRLNRLAQMKFLKLATEKDKVYKITKLGKIFNKASSFILKLWGLRRL